MAEKAEREQKETENGRQKELYNTSTQLSGRRNRQTAAVKSKNWELLQNKDASLAIWREHFEEVLNRNTPESPTQDGKASGADQITAKMLQQILTRPASKKTLKHNFDQVWKNEKVPEWKGAKGMEKGIDMQISKKGNLQ